MVIIQFRQDLLHNGVSEECCFGADAELFTICVDRSHLTVIQVDDLSVTTNKGSLLLLEIFRIHSGCADIFPFSHDIRNKILPKVVN